jgi:chromosome segregation ATPase
VGPSLADVALCCSALLQELRGRVAGRNADECDEVTEGLCELLAQWDRRENKIERTLSEANKALWEFRQLASELKKSDEAGVNEDYRHRRSAALEKELQEQIGPLKEVNKTLQLRVDAQFEECEALRAELVAVKEALVEPSVSITTPP